MCCQKANLVATGSTSDDKVGIMTTLVFSVDLLRWSWLNYLNKYCIKHIAMSEVEYRSEFQHTKSLLILPCRVFDDNLLNSNITIRVCQGINQQSKRACHSGGHNWNYYRSALSLSHITATHSKIRHPQICICWCRIFPMSYTDIIIWQGTRIVASSIVTRWHAQWFWIYNNSLNSGLIARLPNTYITLIDLNQLIDWLTDHPNWSFIDWWLSKLKYVDWVM